MMMKIAFLILILGIAMSIVSCDPVNPSPYQRKWKAKTVKENSTIVYDMGSNNNLYPAYQNFLLDLSDTSIVTLREFTGQSMTGKWRIIDGGNSGKILRLSQLLPQPEQSGGVVEYFVKKDPPEELILVNTKANPKTGNSINEYVLIPQ